MDNIARTHPPALHFVAQMLRNLALKSGPDTREEIKYGGILFSGLRSFCGVFVYASHVTLEFSDGAALPDPGARLLGKGKGRRHLKFTAPDETALAEAAQFIGLARALADHPSK